MKIDQLKNFLIEAAEHGYGAGVSSTLEKDTSHTIEYVSENFKMHDNFFGGEPYGGREVVFYKGKPAWIMVYYGAVDSSTKDFNPVYEVLKKALMNFPKDLPLRGPASLKDGSFEYKNKWQGNLASFSGKEIILKNGKEVYFANYSGGLVDQNFIVDENN